MGAADSGGIADPTYLAQLDGFANWLRAQDGVRHVASFTDVMKRVNKSMHGDDEREYRLKKALEKIAHKYVWIIIDCPPSLNMLTLNALAAANSVLIPMQCEYYALEGLASLLETIEQVRSSVNPGLEIEGLLRTMYDSRNNLSGAVSEQLTEHFGDRVYRTLIPRNVAVAEAPSYGLPVLRYAPASKGALAYLGLAGEVLRRHRKRQTG